MGVSLSHRLHSHKVFKYSSWLLSLKILNNYYHKLSKEVQPGLLSADVTHTMTITIWVYLFIHFQVTWHPWRKSENWGRNPGRALLTSFLTGSCSVISYSSGHLPKDGGTCNGPGPAHQSIIKTKSLAGKGQGKRKPEWKGGKQGTWETALSPSDNDAIFLIESPQDYTHTTIGVHKRTPQICKIEFFFYV